MAKKHLKKSKTVPPGPDPEPQGKHAAAQPEPQGRHAAPDPEPQGRHAAVDEYAHRLPEQPAPTRKKRSSRRKKKDAPDEETVAAVLQAITGGEPEDDAPRRGPELVPPPGPEPELEPEPEMPAKGRTPGKHRKMDFHRDRTKRTPEEKKGRLLSHRDAVGAVISLTAAAVLLAATVVMWLYRDSFSPDDLILSADTVAVARDEYVFDAGSGEAFAAAGQGLAVANASGLELLDSTGSPVTSMVMQMEDPTAAGCADFAVFYDLGGRRLAVARFDGTVEELSVEGDILSATVSQGGYIAVTTEATGYRALVTVYDPSLEKIYESYSSSAWAISGAVSPDGRKLAVLCYTTTGSEVRFFDLGQDGQQSVFSVSGTVLLDLHWFTSSQLCAFSSDQVLFFNASGEWQNTYSFNGRYLVGYTFDGANCAAFALSPYRAGTTATLVSLDASGTELGSAEVNSEIVCLTAADLEIMVLCSDGAVLYNSSLSEKGRLNGLPGFKYGLLRSRGEALLIASNYAEIYTF